MLGFTAKAPSTLGTFLRSFRWGPCPPTGPGEPRVAGPGLEGRCRTRRRTSSPSTLIRRSARPTDWPRRAPATTATPVRGAITRCWPSPPAPATWLMARLREGRANTARGAAHFLRETVGRVRYCGARGQLTVRADSGFYTHAVVAVCRRMDVRFSIAIRQRARLRNLIEAIPEDAWTPIPYWMDGAADVAETPTTHSQAEADAAPVRLIVRRLKPAPGSQLALFATYRYHRLRHRPGRGDAGTGGRSSPSRRDRECDTPPQVRRGAEPSPLGPLRRQRRLAGGTGDGAQPGPLDSPHRPGVSRS